MGQALLQREDTSIKEVFGKGKIPQYAPNGKLEIISRDMTETKTTVTIVTMFACRRFHNVSDNVSEYYVQYYYVPIHQFQDLATLFWELTYSHNAKCKHRHSTNYRAFSNQTD